LSASGEVLSWVQFLIVYLTGTLAGFINVVGGGGSILTLPVLMWIGLPSSVANATNRIAILSESIAGAVGFSSKGIRPERTVIPAVIFASAGSILGSFFVLSIQTERLNRVIAILLLLATFITVFRPPKVKIGKASLLSTAVVFLVVGFYGGFIQAGVGFLLMAAITFVFGFDLVLTNATKVVTTLVYTSFSVIVFASRGMIDWIPGLVLSLGNMTGAFLAVRLSVRKGVKFTRWILIVVVLINTIKYLLF
jgi:uncharacterized membrane protein YfcA